MAERPVALIVHETGNCPLLKQDDRWIINGRDVSKPGGVKLCGSGLCSVYPKLQDILKSLRRDATLPDDYLLCDTPGCDAAFRMEFSVTAMAATGDQANITRRLDRSAVSTAAVRKSVPFLSRLEKPLAAELIGACRTMRYEDGEIILMQGIVGQYLYIVAEGHVDIVRRSEGKDGKDETVLVTLNRGDCCGEMSILTGEVTSAEVRSKGKSAVMSLHKDALEQLLLKRPTLSREFSKLLAERLKATNVSLESELSRGILGKLSMISLVDLVQTLSQSRRTGTLVLTYFQEKARVGFKNGTLCNAVVGDVMGDEAFYKVVCWPDGDFCFEQTEPDDTGRVQTDLMGLMMEGMRRMDEAKAKLAEEAQAKAAASAPVEASPLPPSAPAEPAPGAPAAAATQSAVTPAPATELPSSPPAAAVAASTAESPPPIAPESGAPVQPAPAEANAASSPAPTPVEIPAVLQPATTPAPQPEAAPQSTGGTP